jgi:hypothetical protein
MNLRGPRLVQDLVSLIQQAEADDTIRVLVFKSADPEYFISHVDVTRIGEYREATAKLTGEASLGLLFSSPPALADLHRMKLHSSRVVGTEVGFSLAHSNRSLVGPGIPGAPHPVATGRLWPRSTFPRVLPHWDPAPTTH